MNQSEKRKFEELEKRLSILEKQVQIQLPEELQHNIKLANKKGPMKSKHQVVVETNLLNKTRIMIDGIDFSESISSIKFVHNAGIPATMEMSIINCEINLKFPRIPNLPEPFNLYYRPI